MHFYFHSHPICLATFLFLHGIGKKRFKNTNGVSTRMHGNCKCKPWNAVSPMLPPEGLSKERQAYLCEQIQPFCQFEYHDITCPIPQGFHEKLKDTATPRSKRICSNCRLPGHTKTKKGKITCPSPLNELYYVICCNNTAYCMHFVLLIISFFTEFDKGYINFQFLQKSQFLP